MKNIILTEEQIEKVIDNLINEGQLDNQGLAIITDNLNKGFNKLNSDWPKQIKNANNMVNMTKLLVDVKNYLYIQIPNSIKVNKSYNDFLNEYFKFLHTKFDEESNNIGWGKKKLVRASLGRNIEKGKTTIDTWKFKNIIFDLLVLGQVGGTLNDQWAQNYLKLTQSNQVKLYGKIRDILLQKIYS